MILFKFFELKNFLILLLIANFLIKLLLLFLLSIFLIKLFLIKLGNFIKTLNKILVNINK